jgi:hypothetical protein
MNEDPASLDRLHDIVLPHINPWWPLAVGWYWLGSLILLISIYVCVRAFIHWRHNCYRREALAELSRCERLLADPAQKPYALYKIAELLKRTAVTAYPREEVATLTGPDWFAFLDRTGKGSSFSVQDGAILERAIYDSASVAQFDDTRINALVSTSRQWLKSHRREIASQGQAS